MPRCKNCKEKFTPKYNSFEKFCLEKDECIKAFADYVKEQKEKQRAKKWKKEKKVIKEKLETKTDIEKKLQKEINLIVRLIDKGHKCTSSNRDAGNNPDAGHIFSVGSNPQIRFHLMNIFIQSVHDNQWKSGNQLDYIENIKELFGSEIQEEILNLKGLPSLHLSKEDLKDKISIARGIVKWLKLQDRQFSHEERISLRKRFNKEMGIYGD